ncbi:hypothetical protein [uncultured Paraglaciecola sp.]|uniref:hypothetical protein n=1 Tax=uncultured Paraglaciecola sp. TaxID=1765024 RepID=UPI0030DC54E3
MMFNVKYLTLALLTYTLFSLQTVTAEEVTNDTDKILITVVLKHQQDKNLTELQRKMDESRFWQSFPPEGVEIESWYVAMGLGQVITVKIHPKDLRKLNLAIEKSAWGAFTTDIYPTYEFRDIAKSIKAEKLAADKK